MENADALGANLQWTAEGKLDTKGIATAEGLDEFDERVNGNASTEGSVAYDIAAALTEAKGYTDAEVKEWDIQCYSLCYTLATLARDMFCDRLCGQGFRLLLKTLNRDIVQNDLENMSVERFMSCVFARSKRDYYSERYPLFLKNSMQYYSELWAQIKETALSLMSMNVEKMEAVTQGIALGMYMNESLEFEEFL